MAQHKSADSPKADAKALQICADMFLALELKFREAGERQGSPEELRWTLCLVHGVAAATLFCECLDQDVFGLLKGHKRRWNWDFRIQDDERARRALVILVKFALRSAEIPAVVQSDRDPQTWAELDGPHHTKNNWHTICQNWDDGGREEILQELLRFREEERRTRAPEELKEENNLLFLATWFAAIRWWLFKVYPQRFPGNFDEVFHPWIDDLYPNPKMVGLRCANQNRLSGPFPRQLFRKRVAAHLRAHAQIQADACRLIAEELTNAVDGKTGANRSKETPPKTAPNMPPKKALQCWHTHNILLGCPAQEVTAKKMTAMLHTPISQGQVSKWLSVVEEYTKAGCIVPSIDKIQAMDPAKLDIGPRQDRGVSRRRANSESGSD